APKGVRVGLVDLVAAVLRNDVVLVEASLARLRRARIPDARAVAGLSHRVLARIPAVEVAHHRHRGRIRRPHRELDGAFDEVRAELLVEPRVRAFTEKIKVVTGQRETGSGDSAHEMSFITTRLCDLSQWLYF